MAARSWAILVLALCAPGPLFAFTQENLQFRPPPDWELGHTQQTKDLMVMEFVRKGEAVESWTELLTLHQFRRGKNSQTFRESYEGLKAIWEQRCPGLTEWRILDETEGLFVYEWKTTGACVGHQPQTELVRLIFGRKTGYRVGYNTRRELTAEMRATWREWLNAISLGR